MADDESTFPDAPKRPSGATRKRPSQAGFKRGHLGWTVMPAPSKRMTRIYKTRYAEKHLVHLPDVVWFPGTTDWDGCIAVIDAMMENNLDALYEWTLRFPEHTFGFEALLRGHDRGGEVAERKILRTQPLPRDHRLDYELVRLFNGRVQVRAILRRVGSNKEVARDILWDGTVAADVPESLTNPAESVSP